MINQQHPNRDEMKNRPIEPDHPMSLEGGVIDGDLRLMVRCQLEDMLMFGTRPEELLAMADDPNFQGLYAAKQTLGQESFEKIFEETLKRIGIHRVSSEERAVQQYSESFIPLATLNSTPAKEQDHA
ncbi:MAG: hypothetical protein KC944_06260 [Candidatus Omnitrophica bacterium]|nr:hypothetical protein [Candidatus Omnitrophota bacterium]MCA9436958.1 hypothetical protein [Candidatus Omnitrophota bacterium]MCA9440906.1 hypothetical protein [Candidatus Omnitrophota bacterium]